MECAQMNNIVVRPEREMVSDCGGKKVGVMYETKGEGTPENAIGEELQVQERVATAATTTLPTLEDTVADGDSNPTEDEIHATEFDQ
ncbi:hypothetical protein FRC03_004526 [Tulasnella sp. 419]|nr:hypothetical protein FRC03_004526 [Tulasnella sp. 419]